MNASKCNNFFILNFSGPVIDISVCVGFVAIERTTDFEIPALFIDSFNPFIVPSTLGGIPAFAASCETALGASLSGSSVHESHYHCSTLPIIILN